MLKLILISVLSFLSTVQSQTLLPCKIQAPDQITQLLPNYTGSVQPCSYSGFAPLDPKAESALFYWYFPNIANNPNAPFLLWLQGGPGASSMFGALVEFLSPFTIAANGAGGYKIVYNDEERALSWASEYNILFIDNPIGAGFSYTTDPKRYPTTEDQLSDDLWTALQYFVGIHPETLNMKWYYTGESYAGRYVPAIAHYTLKYNAEIRAKIRRQTELPLKGILVGDGYVHGVQQRFTEIDVAVAATMLAPYQVPQAKALKVNCENVAANQGWNSSIAVDTCNKIPSYLAAVSGIDAYAIQISANETNSVGAMVEPYLNNQAVYKALNVLSSKKKGPLYTDSDENSERALKGDILNNSIYFIESVLSQIPSLYFAGNFDARDGSYGYYLWFELLGQPWRNILNQTRNIWYLENTPVGFWQVYNNFSFVTITNAGHFAPYFQIDVSRKMVGTFTSDKNWDPYKNHTNVSTVMCNYMNNCNGHGKCGANGMCTCNPGYFLEDCSLQPDTFNPLNNRFTLNPRGFLYLKFDVSGLGRAMPIQGEYAKYLDVFYSFNKVATFYQEADGMLGSDRGDVGKTRKLILETGANSKVVYVTIQNAHYFTPVEFSINSFQSVHEDDNESETVIEGQDLIPSVTVFVSSLVLLVATLVIVKIKNQNGNEEFIEII